MLGKLIKHEFKATYKICVTMILFIVIVTLLGCISFRTPMWYNAFSNRDLDKLTAFDVMGLFSLFFYILALIGIIWGMLIYLGYHFYRTMYSEEGYLAHTLPVSSHQLLISKILVGGIWQIVFIILVLLSVTALLASLLGVALSSVTNGMSIFEFFDKYQYEIRTGIHETIGDYLDVVRSAKAITSYVILLVIGSFQTMTVLAGAMTLGQLSGKHKVMMSIVSYFGILFVSQIVRTVVTMPMTLNNTARIVYDNSFTFGYDSIISPSTIVTTVINIAIGVGLYLTSNYIITKKLNLE